MSTTTPATSRGLLERIDGAWRPFRDAVGRIVPARSGATTSSGWTYGDLVAHIAAWEDRTARRLRVYRETSRRIGPEGDPGLGIEDARDTDAFNARVTGLRRGATPEALLADLDAAHRAVTAEIALLSDEQMARDPQPTPWGEQSWVVAVTAGNTFAHYREHAAEVGIG